MTEPGGKPLNGPSTNSTRQNAGKSAETGFAIDVDLVDEDARRRFESDWNPRKLDEIETYLPDVSDQKYWPTLEELLYIDLEFAWKEFSRLPAGETVSVNHSPTVRLKSISRRLKLDQNRDLLQRLWDYENSLKEESRKRVSTVENETRDIGLNARETPLWQSPKDSPAKDSTLAGGIDRDFGGYRLLEILGRGGMGIVFRAVEKKTGRQVALKMIRSNMISLVDEDTRQVVMDRFHTEARAVANIEHQNIVTLYEVGVEDQTPYLSMQLVDGEDLSSRTRQSVLEGKVAARYIGQVSRAISAAHSKGIIHRDIKPHNILLDTVTDQPLVTDFGLAKLNDEGAGLTETGELLGTPAFMSPEQAQGEKVDEGTDVYSLGATLYCLIGGRAPFQAADTLKTIEQIVKTPPISPREVNPDVDVDLNTICLKCLEKDPRKRYASASDLADDLERYLDNRPIHARPIGSIERSLRWCQRNKLPTTIGISLVVLFVVAIAGFLWSAHFSRLNLANANLSFEANQTELFLIAEDQTLNLPGMGATKKRLLAPLRDFFEEFIRINQNYPGVQQELAFAHFALGKISHELLESRAAIGHLNEAIKIQKQLVKKEPDNLEFRLNLSNSQNLRGECYLKLGEADKSFTDLKDANDLRLELVGDRPSKIEYQRKLANTQMNLANWSSRFQKPGALGKAEEHYQESIGTREKVLDSIDDKTSLLGFNSRYDQAKCLFNLSATQSTFETSESALVNAKKAMDLFAELHKEKPSNLFVARDKARCAQLLASLDLDKDPSFYFGQIADAYIHITRLYPTEKQYFWLAADALTYLGDFALENAKLAEIAGEEIQEQIEFGAATESFRQAWQMIKDIEPTTSDEKMFLVNVCLGWIPIHLRQAENVKASQKLERASTILDGMSEGEHPDMSEKQERIKILGSVLDRLPNAN